MLSSDDNVNLKQNDDAATEDDVVNDQHLDKKDNTSVVLEHGRVLRKSSISSRKNSTGPVLRATVKPVKRFRPDCTSDDSSSMSLFMIIFMC